MMDELLIEELALRRLHEKMDDAFRAAMAGRKQFQMNHERTAGAIFAAHAVTTAAIQSDSSMTTDESRRGLWKGSNARRIGPLLAQFGCYLFVWF
jgi:hypothetical protein